MKKIIVLMITIVVLLMASLVSANVQIQHQKNETEDVEMEINKLHSVSPLKTIYVDDDALPGGDGSYEHPFQTIQEGVNAAVDGDTVLVLDGNYIEKVDIEKSIKLLSQNNSNTIIEGNVDISSTTKVTLYNFTIKGQSDENLICLYSSSKCIISQNILDGKQNTYPQDAGIFLEKSEDNTISGNTLTDLYDGVFLENGANNNKVSNNIIKKISNGCFMIGTLIPGGKCEYNTITGNTMDNINCGIALLRANCNTIKKNIINHSYCLGVGILLIFAEDNIILQNTISYFYDGIELVSSSNNEIAANNITDNELFGILAHSSSGNLIYYNNFLRNGVNSPYQDAGNAWDELGINYWYNNVEQKGNYWDDYTGEDNDGDGIGDTPYPIPGGDNEDKYPLMVPYYNAPDAPTIDGPTSGKPGSIYMFIFSTTDPEEKDVYYYIDWGDNTFEEWIGPYCSGEEAIFNHAWSEKGTYYIRAKAKNIDGVESPWGTLKVTMPRNKIVNRPFFNFLQNHPHMFPLLRQLLGL